MRIYFSRFILDPTTQSPITDVDGKVQRPKPSPPDKADVASVWLPKQLDSNGLSRLLAKVREFNPDLDFRSNDNGTKATQGTATIDGEKVTGYYYNFGLPLYVEIDF